MKRFFWIAWILLAFVVALPLMAWASPPDPTWIRGIYDDADFDDVVTYLTSGSTAVPVLSIGDAVPLFVYLPALLPCNESHGFFLLLSSHSPRAPPLA